MEDGDAARGLRAIVRGFVESDASMFLIDRDDFVKQVVEDLRGEGFDVHVALADVTDEAQMVWAFAEIGEVWGNLYTQVNNARIITIKDLEPPASWIFSASCNSSINSVEMAEKLFTKLSGFLISCAMPAVSWPSEASFCV